MEPIEIERFEELVSEALDGLPPDLGTMMDNVAVFVEDTHWSGRYLGLYQGVPLTKRNNGYGVGAVMPDRITLYRLPLCRRSRTEEELVEQVRRTVIHEVAHHFGIDDDRLDELGWA
jgi:predicted Zn-dependent protease with MMP-like domain